MLFLLITKHLYFLRSNLYARAIRQSLSLCRGKPTMGLMYIFSTDLDDLDRTQIINDSHSGRNNPTLILKTYGLPMIFWGYLSAALIVVAAMWLASRESLLKLMTYQDDLSLRALGYLVQYTLLFIPIVLLDIFFFEKQIKKSGNNLTLIYKIFFITIFSKKIILDGDDSLKVDHFMDSPNLARINRSEEHKGFENKGYFELHAISGGKSILIDRHSRKADLLKIKELLLKY